MKKIVSSAAITLSIAFGISTPSHGLSYNWNDPCVGNDLDSAVSGNRVIFKSINNSNTNANNFIVSRSLASGATYEATYHDNADSLDLKLAVSFGSSSTPLDYYSPFKSIIPTPYAAYPSLAGTLKRQTNTETYSAITSNDFKHAKDEPLSTISIDVDTASYTNVRRYLNTVCLHWCCCY